MSAALALPVPDDFHSKLVVKRVIMELPVVIDFACVAHLDGGGVDVDVCIRRAACRALQRAYRVFCLAAPA